MLLHTTNLTKDYDRNRALNALNLTVKPGEIVGLLGPNGSGKSTAIRLMLGFIKPTAGTAKVNGFDCWKQSVDVRRMISYLPGELRLYEGMTGRKLIQFLGSLRGDHVEIEAEAMARQLDIDIDRPLTQMSSGMKRKVALIAVLTPKVPLVILDEPTNTLDPTMRDELLDQLQQAKQAGKAVLFSSHVMQEVESICDRVVILKKGTLVHEEDVVELRKAKHVTGKFNMQNSENKYSTVLKSPNGEDVTLLDGHRFELTHRGPVSELMQWLAQQPLEDVKIEPQGLSPVYKRFHGNLGESHRVSS